MQNCCENPERYVVACSNCAFGWLICLECDHWSIPAHDKVETRPFYNFVDANGLYHCPHCRSVISMPSESLSDVVARMGNGVAEDQPGIAAVLSK